MSENINLRHQIACELIADGFLLHVFARLLIVVVWLHLQRRIVVVRCMEKVWDMFQS